MKTFDELVVTRSPYWQFFWAVVFLASFLWLFPIFYCERFEQVQVPAPQMTDEDAFDRRKPQPKKKNDVCRRKIWV